MQSQQRRHTTQQAPHKTQHIQPVAHRCIVLHKRLSCDSGRLRALPGYVRIVSGLQHPVHFDANLCMMTLYTPLSREALQRRMRQSRHHSRPTLSCFITHEIRARASCEHILPCLQSENGTERRSDAAAAHNALRCQGYHQHRCDHPCQKLCARQHSCHCCVWLAARRDLRHKHGAGRLGTRRAARVSARRRRVAELGPCRLWRQPRRVAHSHWRRVLPGRRVGEVVSIGRGRRERGWRRRCGLGRRCGGRRPG